MGQTGSRGPLLFRRIRSPEARLRGQPGAPQLSSILHSWKLTHRRPRASGLVRGARPGEKAGSHKMKGARPCVTLSSLRGQQTHPCTAGLHTQATPPPEKPPSGDSAALSQHRPAAALSTPRAQALRMPGPQEMFSRPLRGQGAPPSGPLSVRLAPQRHPAVRSRELRSAP